MKGIYQTNEEAGVVGGTQEDMAREGAWRLLAVAVRDGREWTPGQGAI